MFDAAKLAEKFVGHVSSCPSGIVACSVQAAFESWFQVELAQMMCASDGFDAVQFGYDYPGTRYKADLSATVGEHRIVFELKCFVSKNDAKKMESWPEQIERLRRLVYDGHAAQGVALSTFSGYKKEKLSDLIKKFHPSPWNVAGPCKFYETEEVPLQLVVATVNFQREAR